MELVNFISNQNTLTFMLLFVRMSALFLFFPFFSHTQIPFVIKTSLSLLFTILFFPMAKIVNFNDSYMNYLVFEILSEALFGLCAGIILYLVFAALQLAGEQIAFVMGLTMANVIDPQSGINTPIISNILNFIALILFLLLDCHHVVIMFFSSSLDFIPLGGFYPNPELLTYISKSVVNLFMFGFIIAFPVLAFSLMADFIFGMLMKTMPQFNLLIVGYPIKICMAYVVLIVILGIIMEVFKKLLLAAMNNLPNLFFS
ncbi:flagellar type III secretion system protein FliR [Campylobacter sp. RM12327]|uniref:flagellar biosynthetic protein FliR n=1 Tax=Campylobacter sputorum TaxID=206 RepID=UPI00053BF282|nr:MULTISPECIES: flagellar biosynthetic protein FliR [Campylobacter]ASM39714.1 flagellar export apparatus, flagellar biosynthetic protein FliR [Campylobacter sputorum]MBE7358086.1 flagellar type III secretion system protein FliR [Campylobacter sp. RM11302]MBF6668898.1 flagellar type III secretion system protein FliR [Campylobacter sp. RM12327]MBF6673812.1 flagellar type III secretion system protein FliR [Campylobacter sp. RM13538]MBF6676284.1 flagellar type III secretion system protein FliR [C